MNFYYQWPLRRSPMTQGYILKCKNEYLVFALGEETAVQAVVGSIAKESQKAKESGDERPQLRAS